MPVWRTGAGPSRLNTEPVKNIAASNTNPAVFFFNNRTNVSAKHTPPALNVRLSGAEK